MPIMSGESFLSADIMLVSNRRSKTLTLAMSSTCAAIRSNPRGGKIKL